MDFSDIQLELGVGTQCGSCESCARDVVAQCSATSPVAAIQLASPHPGKRSMDIVNILGLSVTLVVGAAWWVLRA